MNSFYNILKREVILMISLFLFTKIVFGQLYNFKKVSVEDGLSSPGVYSMCEGPKGKLWIGLEGEGVNVYDGWEVVQYSEHFLGTNIRAIFKGSSNHMFFGSEHEGLAILSNGSLKRITIDDGLFVNHIRAITEDKNGLIWLATLGGGVSVIKNGEVIQNFHKNSGLPSLNCRTINSMQNGEVWVGTDNGIAIISEGKVIRIINESSGLTHNKILSIKEGNGVVWIGANSGATAIQDGDTLQISNNNQLVDFRVKSIEVGKDGDVWFGTQFGIGKVVLQSIKNKEYSINWFDDEKGLSNNRVRCLYMDQSKAIWAGTYFGGINRLFNESFSMYNKTNGLLDNVIMAVKWNKNDSTIWLGSHDNGLDVLTKDSAKCINKSNGLSENHVTSIAHLKNGYSIIGTTDGLNLVKDYELVRVWDNYDGVFKGNHISDLVSNEDAVLGLTINNELFYIKDSGNVYLDYFISNQLNKKFDSMHKKISNASNSFWISTDSSICALKIDKNRIGISKELNISNVVKIVGDEKVLFGFTKDKKLFKIEDDEVVWELQLKKTEEIKFVLNESKSSYWVCLKGQIMHVKFVGDTYDLKHFSINEGFMGGAAIKSAVTMDENGDIFVGTIKGLIRIQPNKYKGVKRDLKVYLEGILYNNREEDWSKFSDSIIDGIPVGLKLPYKMNHLTFKYRSYHLKSPKEVIYEIELKGDDDYKFETSNIEEEFVDISPGEYEIRISSKTQWGNWSSSPLVFKFEITPPFWMTRWFQIGSVFLFLGLLLTSFKLRTRKLEREKEKLELLVAERTRDLNEEKHKSEELLLNILPFEVANELKMNGYAKTRKYEKASVLFTDFKGFTKMSSNMSPEKLVRKLDEIFVGFDEVIDNNNLEKIKTIGDSYMCVSGIPEDNPNQVKNIVLAGLQLIDVINRFNEKQKNSGEPEWGLRVGIHTGDLIAGVVGKKKFAYDVWGDTVNVASRMESNSEPGKVNISNETYEEVKLFFDCTFRGRIIAKNRGELEMYFVEGLSSKFNDSFDV